MGEALPNVETRLEPKGELLIIGIHGRRKKTRTTKAQSATGQTKCL